jgi:branched-chain amino acid transport system substrate-binding protein
MKNPIVSLVSDRRALLKGAAAIGALQIASPFVVPVRAADNIKMGMVDPLTGVYAAPAGNEVMGAKLAVDQINAKGGILGRQVELLVEDSANDVGTGVQKARKLIERDNVNFIIGDVNSGIAAAIAQVTAEKKVLHVVSGGHTDTITGKDCHWNVYRVCNTTRMEANSVSDLLYNK